jgi:adenylate cyclase
LERTRAVEAGRLNGTLAVTSHDEIGHLTAAFNHMVEQLRLKERIRETFGRYVDPRIVEGLISRPALASEGERRVMTMLFCDVKGFVGVSEEMTPQGLVKVMNGYFSAMSAPIHLRGGIIDKYVGDAIMAYWGPPFTADADQAVFAALLRSTCWIGLTRSAGSYRTCSVCATCRSCSISASASLPARCLWAASAPK